MTENDTGSATLLSKEEILAQRAIAAAKSLDCDDEECIEVVEFILGQDVFAFEMQKLSEVCTLGYVTQIPTSAPYVLGVISLRGQIVPIIELREFMNLSRSQVNVFYKALILRDNDLIVGFLADDVPGARLVRHSELQQVIPSALNSAFIKAVTNDRLVILDSAKLLADPRLRGKE